MALLETNFETLPDELGDRHSAGLTCNCSYRSVQNFSFMETYPGTQLH